MRVLVDTSVWVDFFNGHPSAEARALEAYLDTDADIATCGVVLAEFFQGLRSPASVTRLERYFGDMLLLSPSEPASYLAAASLFRELRGRGVTVRSTIDCLVAVIATEGGAAILAKDRDMRAIVESGVIAARLAPLPPTESA